MAIAEGYVTVFEATDVKGSTTWQVFIDDGVAPRQAVITTNERLAETLQLAIKTNSIVKVSYDDLSHVMSQVRIAFNYVCEMIRVTPCGPVGANPEPQTLCVTRKYSRCDPGHVPRPEE